ncbi:hypothetical protein MEO93_29780, partial [Dolichospermum sp. ST_sed3]|nr:hypothetical protein [Dolichospermum sp. ST_sed3]
PEVLATQDLDLKNPHRHHPSARTDLHALAVLIYEYLLSRHPLKGPKVNSVESAEEDEFLSMGSKALFIEHPEDTSNRPADISVSCTDLGKTLSDLFSRAFVTGLHSPDDRPAAIEWERGLIKTWDSFLPCQGSACSQQWFILKDPASLMCPFCKTMYTTPVPVLKLRSERREGQWMNDGQVVVYDSLPLFGWHVMNNAFPGEEAVRTPLACCTVHQGKWLLVNQLLTSLTLPGGNRVPPGQAAELTEGSMIRLSQEPHGRIAEVQILHP